MLNRRCFRIVSGYQLVIDFVLIVFWAVSLQAVELSDTPLDVQLISPLPNLMVIVDNSADMDAEILTMEANGLFQGKAYLFPQNSHYLALGTEKEAGSALRKDWRLQWNGYNQLYYNANYTYCPWPGTDQYSFSQADLQRPWCNPIPSMDGFVRLHLADPFFTVVSHHEAIVVPNAHYFAIEDLNGNRMWEPGEPVYLTIWVDSDADGQLDASDHPGIDYRRYYRFTDDGDGLVENDELVLLTEETEKNHIRPAWYDSHGEFLRFKSDREDLQNFANWVTYYRRRLLSAKAAAAQTISGLKDVNAGLYPLNGQVIAVHPVNLSTGDNTVSVDNRSADDLLNRLYELTPRGGKNLRFALDEVGRYFHRRHASGIGPSPLNTEEQGGACQHNLALMVSDGIWNGKFSGVGNADGDQGAPYADSWPNTLADVAMYYFKTDLDTGLPDQVGCDGSDTTAHQHMTTFAIALGRTAHINPYDIDGDGQMDDPDMSFRNPAASLRQWPQPLADNISCIDDFQHAALNGRGGYYHFPAVPEIDDDAGGFQLRVSRLSAAVRPEQISGAPATGDMLLEDGTLIYRTYYDAGSWTGDVLAFRNTTDSTTIQSDTEEPLWSAAERLDAFRENPDARRVITYGENGENVQGRPFRYHTLSDPQKKMLGFDVQTGSAADHKASALLDYLRGGEDRAFRQRETLLGDIVNSSPLVVGNTLYVGANDGMLHAFDIGSGDERFAYVPNGVFGRLAELGTYGYSQAHRFYVDGTPTAGEIIVNQFQRHTLLVGGYGKGGRGYYCLCIRRRSRTQTGDADGPYEDDFNVDDIGESATEASISHMVMWEYPKPDPAVEDEDHMDNDGDGVTAEQGEYDPDIGYSLGQGYAVNANVAGKDRFRPVVVFSNGYNSANGRAVLYVLDAFTGELIRKIDTGAGGDNGLSIPALIDVDSDRCIDYVYAGDLNGNLWKFDLSSETPEAWGVAYGEDLNCNGVIDASDGDIPMPLFTATGQSITSRPDVMFAQSTCAPQAAGFLVIFGTGRYLGLSDKKDISQQSIYGIWDYGDDSDDSEFLGYLTERTDGILSSGLRLVPQVLSLQTVNEETAYRRFDENHPVLYSSTEDIMDGDGYHANDDGNDQQPNPVRDVGWFFDFPIVPDVYAEPGERVISDVTIRGGRAVVMSYVPDSQPCTSGGSAWLYLVDGCFNESVNECNTEKNNLLDSMTALRFNHRLTTRSLFFKEQQSLFLDQLLVSDQSGHLLKIPFSGEVWGKSYWRQNLQ